MGFTLIEVLLSMAIFAAVLGVVYASFSTSGRNIEQAEKVRDDTDLARMLIMRLSDDIGNAYIRGFGTVAGFVGKKEEAEIDGEELRIDSLSLTTLTNYWGRRQDTKEMDLWEVGYLFKDTPDGKVRILVRREKRELSKDSPFLEGGVEHELTDRVKQLRLRYHNGSAWLEEWSNKNALPKRVEIALTLDNDRVYITEVDVRNQ
jgi:type II secretion system protein J